ncbi:hypothetical protein GCM10022419_124640 [Nonomuraea rosea]|uniref:Resolvase/invertase-type recombinase catalytic domain-containing protein n=1 Tax=Nonomuraea rosea TaxID=638574 RepID=A0ABP6ZUQ1_9ACTN
MRPEFAKAMEYALTIKKAVPHQRVIFTAHEMKRLGRGAAELLAIAEELRHHDIELELLTGPLQGVYDPSGHGAALFAFFAGMAESEREYIREKSLEGQASARERGRHGGRPQVFDDDMIAYAQSLRERGVAVPDIARKLVIPTGKNKGRTPRSPLFTACWPTATSPGGELISTPRVRPKRESRCAGRRRRVWVARCIGLCASGRPPCGARVAGSGPRPVQRVRLPEAPGSSAGVAPLVKALATSPSSGPRSAVRMGSGVHRLACSMAVPLSPRT